jgi:hypothetical protein
VGLGALLGIQSPVAMAAVDLSMLRLSPTSANGVRMGPLTIFPSLSFGTEYDRDCERTQSDIPIIPLIVFFQNHPRRKMPGKPSKKAVLREWH